MVTAQQQSCCRHYPVEYHRLRMTTQRFCWVLLCLISFFCLCFSFSLRKLPPVGQTSLCRRCKRRFEIEKNSPTSCTYHKGRFIGAENSKHYGTKSGGDDQGLSIFWDCCDQTTRDGPGCITGKHLSYDEEEEDSFMLNKNLKQQRDYYLRE